MTLNTVTEFAFSVAYTIKKLILLITRNTVTGFAFSVEYTIKN